jgi:hypothetical protein
VECVDAADATVGGPAPCDGDGDGDDRWATKAGQIAGTFTWCCIRVSARRPVRACVCRTVRARELMTWRCRRLESHRDATPAPARARRRGR